MPVSKKSKSSKMSKELRKDINKQHYDELIQVIKDVAIKSKVLLAPSDGFTLSDEAKKAYPFLQKIIADINKDAKYGMPPGSEARILCCEIAMEASHEWHDEYIKKFGPDYHDWISDEQRNASEFVEALKQIDSMFKSLFDVQEKVQFMAEKLLAVQLAAYSDLFRTVIPIHSGHRFRMIPDTNSDHSGHPSRSI